MFEGLVGVFGVFAELQKVPKSFMLSTTKPG
jgi:hypothetical protein